MSNYYNNAKYMLHLSNGEDWMIPLSILIFLAMDKDIVSRCLNDIHVENEVEDEINKISLKWQKNDVLVHEFVKQQCWMTLKCHMENVTHEFDKNNVYQTSQYEDLFKNHSFRIYY